MMEFLCPNGHRIRCQPDQAGRAAKCPRCGVKFRVPNPTDVDVSENAGASDSSISRPEFVDSTGLSRGLPTLGAAPIKEPEIEFLCPNGHRLHGPVNLQGRPGQCPECGSRFRIPTYEEVSSEEETEHEISLGRADGRSPSDSAKPAHQPPPVPPTSGANESSMPTTITRSPGHAMAMLVAQLWHLRSADASLEIHLRDGATIVPDQFLEKSSQEHHEGVFSVRDAAGTLSLVVVAWDAIARATLRGLVELPKDFAE